MSSIFQPSRYWEIQNNANETEFHPDDFHPGACAILAMMPINVKRLERDFLPTGT